MGQKELSLLLKIVVVVLAVFLALTLGFFLPPLAREIFLFLAEDLSEGAAGALAYYGIPGVIILSSLPCFVSLRLAWKIFNEIGRNNSFCLENARRLRTISRLALADTALYLVLFSVFFAMGAAHPSLTLIYIVVILFGTAMAIVCAALSHLTRKAADLKSDSDLTI